MRRLGMPVSDTTIRRSLKEHARARSDNGAVHVAGIDDWAWRKGANYGTIIVNLERRQVGDLVRRPPRPVGSRIIRKWRWSAAAVLAFMRRLCVRARRRRGSLPIAFICCRTSARPFSDNSAALRRRSRILGSMPEMIRRRHRFQQI